MWHPCTCSALRTAARRLTQIYDAALSAEGVTTPQYALLNRLAGWPGDPPTMRQLAERIELDRTTLAHNLRPLERDGLVAVTTDPCDRRIRRISLTAAGRVKRDACFPLWRSAQHKFEVDFGPEHAAGLMASLASLSRLNPDPAPAARTLETSHAG